MNMDSKKGVAEMVSFDRTILKKFLDDVKKSTNNNAAVSKSVGSETKKLKKQMRKINEKLSTLI